MEKVFDINSMIERMNGKEEAAKAMIRIFQEDTPESIESLSIAIDKKEFDYIKAISHNLVSSYSIIGVYPAIRLLKAIELNAESVKEIDLINNLFNELIVINEKANSEINELNFT